MELYQPDPTPFRVEDLPGYLDRELRKIAISIAGALPDQLKELHEEPSKLRDFMIVAADGTDWDPGSGQGVYAYYNSAWHLLG